MDGRSGTGGRRALVLGGGGVAGIAWLTGVLAGLAEQGVDVPSGSDVIIGTSAGANVAAQLNQGLTLTELLARQSDPALQNRELTPVDFDFAGLMDAWAELFENFPEPEERLRELGRRALAADTVAEPERRAAVAGRLPSPDWPEGDVRITAVEALTGDLRVFDRASGVALTDAVTASSAVPLVWPPATVAGVRHIDGGARSGTNADLALGYDRVLILAPLPMPPLEDEVALLRKQATVSVLTPDEPSVEAFGPNPLDPSTRTASAAAGLAQGRAAAGAVGTLWNA